MNGIVFGGMDREAIVERALEAVPKYLEWKYDEAPFNVEYCVRMEMNIIRDLYRSRDGRDPGRDLSPEEQAALDAILSDLEGTLVSRTIPFKTAHDRENTVRSINATSASMLIHAKLEEYGFQGRVRTSKSGADVDILIKGSTWMILKFTYASLSRPGYLDGKLQAAMDLRESVIRLGLGTRIKRR